MLQKLHCWLTNLLFKMISMEKRTPKHGGVQGIFHSGEVPQSQQKVTRNLATTPRKEWVSHHYIYNLIVRVWPNKNPIKKWWLLTLAQNTSTKIQLPAKMETTSWFTVKFYAGAWFLIFIWNQVLSQYQWLNRRVLYHHFLMVLWPLHLS